MKFDGYRCLAGRDSTGVTLWSRKGNLFTKQFPHIARACERLPLDSLVDGEIVALDESGRISFKILQHHRSKAQAFLFYVFDVLAYHGRSLLQELLEHRRQVLAEAKTILPPSGSRGQIAKRQLHDFDIVLVSNNLPIRTNGSKGSSAFYEAII